MEFAGDKDKSIAGFVTLHVPCRYSYLRIIRQSVLDVCAMAGFSEFKAAQLEMAVDEACANIIEHSYGGEKEGDVKDQHPGLRLNLIQHDNRVEVEIFDFGEGFDFQGHEAADPDTFVARQQERGLGMYIIKRFVDDVAYDHASAHGNCLRLTKKL